MTLPAFLIGGLVATLLGAGFHFWRGGDLMRLLYYIVLAWAGFWIGHFITDWMGWDFGRFGVLNLPPAIAISLVFLVLGYYLSLIEVERR